MTARPTQLQLRDPQHLVIAWDDGATRAYHVRELRDACTCATCREKRMHPPESNPLKLNILSEADLVPLAIRGMQPVGNYAYSIDFSDGHDTGIYTLEQLHALGTRE